MEKDEEKFSLNDISGSSNDYYAKKEFWNDRFAKTEGFFDWYVGWDELKSLVMKYAQVDSKILMVGCGNSKLSEQMYKDNFKQIVNIDISDVVINKMNEMYKSSYPEMKCNIKLKIVVEMDATNMTFPDNSYDFVFDKGTLDALMCDKLLKAPSKLVQEMYRVTKENGHFVIITYGEPDMRLNFLSSCVNLDEVEKAKIYCEKIELSLLSNLINSLRNRSTDGAINTALKDQNILLNALVDVYETKINDKDLDQATRKKYLCMKILALTKLRKLEKQKKIEQIANDLKNENKDEKLLENIEQKDNQASSNIKEKVSSDEVKQTFNNILNQNISKNENKSENTNLDESKQDEKQNKRRTHCFAYIFKKLELNKN